MAMEKRNPSLREQSVASMLRRVPRALARALGAAIATFLDDLTRSEPALTDLEAFGISQDDLLEALQMILDDGAVRPRKLLKRFGNAMGTNLLSVCEIRRYIAKPERGGWEIDFERVRGHQAEHGR